MKIAHISDTHFGTEDPAIVAALSSTLHAINPDLIVASGDFTMAARHREFRAAADFLKELPAPVLAVPGNHDLPAHNLFERFFRPLRRYRRYIVPITCTEFVSPDAALLGMNSARSWGPSLNWSHGHLSRFQAEQADRFFREHADVPFRALVVHHPFSVPDDLTRFRTIRNGDAMLRVLANNRVHTVLSGHLHRQYRVSQRVHLEGGHHDLTIAQVSTATSRRNRHHANGFVCLTTDSTGLDFANYYWNGASFEPATSESPRNAHRTPVASVQKHDSAVP
ncbi:MAG: metallophosphoesterase [Phycisphaeraceae bacterium]|nr:MAG: metallophosphoesterase [Phycisphaeraceae bacterium]